MDNRDNRDNRDNSWWVKAGALAAIVGVVIAVLAYMQDGRFFSLFPPGVTGPEPPKVPQLVAKSDMVLTSPDCNEINGVDLDTFKVGDLPDDADFVIGNDACRTNSVPFLQGVANAPLAIVDNRPGTVPGIDECIRDLRNSPSGDFTKLDPQGGGLCFSTTAGQIAGVDLSYAHATNTYNLRVVVWRLPT